MRTSGLVNNTTISTKGTKRGLHKLKSIISTKNLWRSGVLSDDFGDEVGDCSDNLRVTAEKVDPTHTSIVINEHDIVAMT